MDKRRIKFGLTAFIDLLGYADKIAAVENEDDVAALEATIKFVQNEFEHRPTDEHKKLEHKFVAKSVLAFTDCLVIFVARKSQLSKSQGEFDVLMQELDGLGLSQGECVMRGHFLRGGVALGYWYKVGDTLISPAQVAAYQIESKGVSVPMIGISDELYSFLAKHPGRRFYSRDIEPVRRVFIRYKIPATGKQVWLIDYLRICLDTVEGSLTVEESAEYKTASSEARDRLRSLAHARACINFGKAHKQLVETARNSASNESVKAKYDWLAKYHNDCISKFFHADAGKLLIQI